MSVFTATGAVPSQSGLRQRLVSIDVFRGMAVAGMFLVDYQARETDAYPYLRHAPWNGWTLADLVFPAFLFLVGVSVVLATSARLDRGEAKRRVLVHALRRSAILFVLGLVLNGFPEYDFSALRIEGVIQRIAICYLAATCLFLWSEWRTQVVTLILVLVGYWVLLRFVPVPGYGMPVRDVPFLDPDGNLTAWLDRKLFAGRLYHATRDPEGLLSTIPAIASSLIGVLAGKWVIRENSATNVRAFAICGVLLLGAGLAWDHWFPINKNLWTSSYVLFAGGCSLLMLAILYGMIEAKGWRGSWTVPFVVLGVNAILAFVLDMLIYAPFRYGFLQASDGSVMSWKDYIYGQLAQVLSAANASLAYSILMLSFVLLLLWIPYRYRLVFRI
jgi:predicted acyltransferase